MILYFLPKKFTLSLMKCFNTVFKFIYRGMAGSIFWSSLEGLPKKVQWPVKVIDSSDNADSEDKVTVFCKSDNA